RPEASNAASRDRILRCGRIGRRRRTGGDTMSALIAGEEAVRIDDLGVTFATDGGDVRAVDGVSLSVRAGEVLAIVGESGSGKTVTAKTILGLLPETATTSGMVLIGRDNVIEVSQARLREISGTGAA